MFRVLTDVELSERWFPARIHETWTSPPPHGVGSTRHAVVTVMGRRSENDATVTEYDPPRRAVLAAELQGMRWTAALDFHDTGDATRVAFDFAADASGPMRLAVGPFLWWYRRAWQRGLATLARMMEAGSL